jgi:DNA-binding NtrC family response regulator
MFMNPMLLYRKRQNVIRDYNRNSAAPAVMNNRLEALRVLANSILTEVSSLEQDREVISKTEIDLAEEVQRFETNIIKCALVRTGGRQRQAARLLKIKPTTLHAKMKRYGILQSDSDEEGWGNYTDDLTLETAN